jgi:outer membrane protein assembly factor BamD (BamD/ComL family)
MDMRRWAVFIVLCLLLPSPLTFAAVGPRGITIREGIIYISPDANSAKLSNIGRGREVVVLERSQGWVQVVGTVEVHPELESERNVTGWMLDKGVITIETPDGDKIIFGEAVDSEYQASERGGRKGAAQDALRLYERLAEYFPSSPLAPEAMYRAADIRWQLDAADQASRPSAKLRDPAMRVPIDESYMKKVMKKYPGTKWADMAAYHLIDNKLCGDWEAQAQCPLKESEIYLKYADERPKSPKAPEALYKAAWRNAALIVIYKTDNQAKKADDAAAHSISIAKKLMSQYPDANDWVMRAETLIYMVQTNIPAWGNNAVE